MLREGLDGAERKLRGDGNCILARVSCDSPFATILCSDANLRCVLKVLSVLMSGSVTQSH
jgi:hypothetical protein